MTYKSPFVITNCFNNVTVKLQCGVIEIKYIIRRIEPYKYDTNVEDIKSKIMWEDVNI